MTRRAPFITLEGGEGTGKSTQIHLLADRLRSGGIEVVVTREPGGSPFAERVRDLLLATDIPAHAALSEALMFNAARADHLAATIRPALEEGRWVLCDRFADSTTVYQGIAGSVSRDALWALDAMVIGDIRPDLTLLLDLPAAEGLARAAQRRAAGASHMDQYEQRALAYHERLRAGFLEIAQAEPERCVVIDAAPAPEAIAGKIWAIVESRLLSRGGA